MPPTVYGRWVAGVRLAEELALPPTFCLAVLVMCGGFCGALELHPVQHQTGNKHQSVSRTEAAAERLAGMAGSFVVFGRVGEQILGS